MNQLTSPHNPTCTEVQDTLEAYLDNELDTDTHATVAAHISSCSTCHNEVRLVQAISEALHELPRPEPPPKIFNEISDYVHAHPDSNKKWMNRISQLFTVSAYLTSPLVRAGALVCLVGVVLFGTYQYQQSLKVQQASRDLAYALSTLNYAVERTGTVVNEKLPNTRINRTSRRSFVRIEAASRRASKQKRNISSALYRSLGSLNRLSQNDPDTEPYQRSQNKEQKR